MALLERLGRLLDRRRVLAYSAMLLAAEIIVSGYLVAASYGVFRPTSGPVTTDFVSFYAAGSLADSDAPERAYHPADHFRAEQQAREPGIEYNYFYYPPVFLLLCAVLARLPYIVAFFIFEGVTLALFLLVMTKILGEAGWAPIVIVLAFPVVFWNFGWGQNGFLTAGLIGAGTLLLDRRPILAGLLFGAVCYKPHFGLLIPVALASGRHWRAFAAASVSVIALVVLSVAVFGTATWRDFFTSALASHATYETGGAKFSAYVTPFGAVMLIGGSLAVAYAVQAVAAIAAISLVVFIWSRGLSLPLRAATLIAATLVAVPLALFYDLLLAAIAVAWLCRSENGLRPTERAVLAACYLVFVYPVDIARVLHLPIAPAAAFAVLIITASHAFREVQNERRLSA